jgi:hypothetical protein
MARMKEYLLRLANIGANDFAKDAIQWAILEGLVQLTYRYHTDKKTIMAQYDKIIEAYQSVIHEMAC